MVTTVSFNLKPSNFKMKKPVILFVLWVFAGTIGFSQSVISKHMTFRGLHIGITPSALVNVYPGLQMSMDYGLNEWLQITNELGAILDVSKTGYRWRPGILFSPLRGHFVSISLGLAYNDRKAYQTFEEHVLRAQGQFTELVKNTRKRSIRGAVLVSYLQFRLSEKLKMRIGGGLGSGIYHSVNLNDGSLVRDDFFPFISNGRGPIFFTHLNFAYHFKHD